MKAKTVLIGRLRLATKLLDAGFKGKRVTNPYHDGWIAFEFEIDADLARIVADYYADEIGKPAPRAVREYMAKIETKEGAKE